MGSFSPTVKSGCLFQAHLEAMSLMQNDVLWSESCRRSDWKIIIIPSSLKVYDRLVSFIWLVLTLSRCWIISAFKCFAAGSDRIHCSYHAAFQLFIFKTTPWWWGLTRASFSSHHFIITNTGSKNGLTTQDKRMAEYQFTASFSRQAHPWNTNWTHEGNSWKKLPVLFCSCCSNMPRILKYTCLENFQTTPGMPELYFNRWHLLICHLGLMSLEEKPTIRVQPNCKIME